MITYLIVLVWIVFKLLTLDARAAKYAVPAVVNQLRPKHGKQGISHNFAIFCFFQSAQRFMKGHTLLGGNVCLATGAAAR